MYKLSKKLEFSDQLFKNIKVENDEPNIEDILREINRGMWTIGYTGQSPERLKAHIPAESDPHRATEQAGLGEGEILVPLDPFGRRRQGVGESLPRKGHGSRHEGQHGRREAHEAPSTRKNDGVMH